MNKIPSFPSSASLVLRLLVTVPYLYSAMTAIGLLSGQAWYTVVLFAIIALANLFILVGFLTRWAALTLFSYYLISGIVALQSAPFGEIAVALLQGTPIISSIVIWLLNSGDYSIDRFIAPRMAPKAFTPPAAPAPMI